MRKILILSLIVAVVSLAAAGPSGPGQAGLKPLQRAVTRISPPKTSASQMDRPGPVRSPDPYFTIKVGEAEIYRDAKDPSLAYYKPVIHLAKRAGTPLAEGVGPLAATLDALRFQYYKFESGGNPKWASVQVVVAIDRPRDLTLEAVQAKWKDVTRLVPLPLRIDAATGTRLTIPYPPRAVSFSEMGPSGAEGENRWQMLSTSTHPSPPDLMTDADNGVLNEAKAKDYASLITTDLGDMPSFQPVLEVRAVFPGWSGATPLGKTLVALRPAAGLKLAPAGGTGQGAAPAPPAKSAVPMRPTMTPQRTTTGTNPAPGPAPAPPARPTGRRRRSRPSGRSGRPRKPRSGPISCGCSAISSPGRISTTAIPRPSSSRSASRSAIRRARPRTTITTSCPIPAASAGRISSPPRRPTGR